MPQFRYRALRSSGAEIAGELTAVDEREAAARLQAGGNFPIEVTQPAHRPAPASGFASRTRAVPARDLVLFTRQLATLTGAGIRLDRALALIAGGRGRVAGRRLAGSLLAAVNRGERLSQACTGDPRLPSHYSLFVAAGEARGDIGAALTRLAQALETSRATVRTLLDALVYPASVIVVACFSVSFLLCFVVPRFQVLLTSFQKEPPLVMGWLLALSAAFRLAVWPAVVAAVGAIGLFAIRYRDHAFRVTAHRLLLRLPAVGALIAKLEAERLLYLLGNLIAAGVRLPDAIAAARSAMVSEAFRAGLALTEQGVERGDGLATALAASGVVPDIAIELVRVGEETDELAPMLFSAGETLRREFETLTPQLIGLVTPLLIILLGLVVGAVAAGILETVMEVYDIAG